MVLVLAPAFRAANASQRSLGEQALRDSGLVAPKSRLCCCHSLECGFVRMTGAAECLEIGVVIRASGMTRPDVIYLRRCGVAAQHADRVQIENLAPQSVPPGRGNLLSIARGHLQER